MCHEIVLFKLETTISGHILLAPRRAALSRAEPERIRNENGAPNENDSRAGDGPGTETEGDRDETHGQDQPWRPARSVIAASRSAI